MMLLLLKEEAKKLKNECRWLSIVVDLGGDRGEMPSLGVSERDWLDGRESWRTVL
jgi:hypothetical protein